MSNYFGKLIGKTHQGDTTSTSSKHSNPTAQTPLQRLLEKPGRQSTDGDDRYYGMENFGNTCYCNSVLQSLYYTTPFKESVLAYPPTLAEDVLETPAEAIAEVITEIEVTGPASPTKAKSGFLSTASDFKRKSNGASPASHSTSSRNDDTQDSTEARKKAALLAGPVLSLEADRSARYGLQSTLFSALRDIFEVVGLQKSRTGVISPKNFIEILRRDNEMYKSAMHQDAHEFLNYLLNTTMESLESYHRPSGAATPTPQNANKLTNGPASERIQPSEDSSLQTESASSAPSEKWVQDLISGTLVSETKCLTCETTSQRDERFLDLSIDLEQNSSLTSCLHKFSAPEMLCERNKFHCDKCGGLQEAEKKTKIKRLPRVLAIHLKRFKWMEEAGRLQKLFHRVAYPNHLRLWNTTSDAEDPDRLYELYAVVVHIGSGPYHGHYVSVIKTPTRGWLLFDDELVEPVAEDFVKNFYGDLPGQACAYVLFYQETTSAGLDEDSAPEVEPTGPIGRQKESGDRTQPEESRLSAFRRGEISGPLKLGGKAAANAKHPFSSIVPPSKVHIFDVSRLERSATTPSRTVGLTAAPEEIIVKSPSAEAVKPEEDSNEVEHLEEAGLPTGRKADVKNGLFKTNPGSRVTSGKGRFKLGSKSRDVQQPAETVDVSEPSTGAAGSTPAPVVAREGRKIHIFGSLRKKASIL